MAPKRVTALDNTELTWSGSIEDLPLLNVPKQSHKTSSPKNKVDDPPAQNTDAFGVAFGYAGPAEKCSEFAEKILMKAVPGNGQLRLAQPWKIHGVGVDLVLAEQIKRIDLKSMKHQPSIIS